MRNGTALRQLLSQAAQAASRTATAYEPAADALRRASAAFASTSSSSTSTATSAASTVSRRLASSFAASAAPPPTAIAAAASSRAFFSSAPVHSWAEVKHALRRQAQVIRPSYEWVLGSGYNARVALVNALYTTQKSTHWGRLVSILLAEAVTRGDPLAWAFSVPVTPAEEAHLAAAEAADVAAAAAAGRGVFGVIWRYLASLARLLYLLFLFAPAVAMAPAALRGGVGAPHRTTWMRLLRRTLERAGPAFIKWGQWAATRADLFPPDLCSELALLHTQAPAHGFSYTADEVRNAFGFDLPDLFASFEREPVASGSIGQIHRATLADAGARLTGVPVGTTVAVKVRHPGVSESIERDFALMMAAAKVASFLPALASLRLEESLKQFSAPLREQVDLGREGFYLHAFNYNFRGEDNVSFPIPLYPLVAPAVLVETFEEGKHISEYVARGAGAPHNSELSQVGARTLLHMMIIDHLIHSDLHPGNILVKLSPPGGAAGAAAWARARAAAGAAADRWGAPDLRPALDKLLRPSIVLLDAGMATRLSPEDQINMVGLFDAFSRLDAAAMAAWTLRFAGEEQTCPDPEAFRNDLETHFSELKASQAFAEGDTSSGAEALAAVLEMVRLHQVNLPGHICATVVTTLVLEGWSHALDPAHSTLSEVKRIIALKKGESTLKKAALWVQGAAVDRQILEHVPQFALEEEGGSWWGWGRWSSGWGSHHAPSAAAAAAPAS